MSGQSTSVMNGSTDKLCLYLLYHELTSDRVRYSYAVPAAEFERHLQLASELKVDRADRLRLEFTFDDGHLSDVMRALPALSAHNFKARFFVTAGWISHKAGYMRWEQLGWLRDGGHRIGAHGWSHMLLPHCSPKDLDRELRGSRSILEDKLGIAVTTMSLPGGRYNARVLEACREAGYDMVFTSEPRLHQATEFTVGRLNMTSRVSAAWLEGLAENHGRGLASAQRQYRIKTALKSLVGDWVYEKLWAGIARKQPEAGVESRG